MVTLLPSVGDSLWRVCATARARKGFATLVLLALGAILSGCSASGFKAQSSATVTVLAAANSSVSFGSVPVGSSANALVKLVNQGSDPVTISKLDLTGKGFSSSAKDSLPITVAAGTSVNVGVQFNPTASGPISGQLAVTNSSTAAPLAVALSGNGTLAAPSLSSVSCASTSIIGATVEPCTVTLSAAASADTTISLASDSSAVAVPASLLMPAGSTVGAFNASVAAVPALQTVTLTATSAGVSQAVALQLGAYFADLGVSNSDVTFGDVKVAASSAQSVVLTATGTAPVTISSAALTGSGFNLTGGTFPMSLSPGQTTTLSVQFAPSAAGTVSGQLTLSTNSTTTSQKKIKLTANAVPQLQKLTCTSGTMTGAGTNTCSVTLNSAAATGGFAVSLASSNSAVAVPASALVPAGSTSATFNATVSAVATTQQAILTATSSGSTKTFTLQLGSSIPTLAVSASTINFGSVAVGSPSLQTLTLSSTGTAAVNVNSASLSGAGFSISGASFPMTLNPGQTATLTIQLTATASGAQAGQLTLSSNSSTGASSVVMLSGTAVPVLSGLICANGSMTGAGSDACTVTLNAAAPAGGYVVSLSSNSSSLTVPANVTVAAGATTAGFVATAAAVSTAQAAILTASAGGSAITFTVELGSSIPTLAISTGSIALGNVAVGSSATQVLTFSSTGTAPVTISAVAINGTGFSISGATFPLTINAGQTATATVRFAPSTAGAVSGQLSLTSNSSTGTSSAVALSATGVSALGGVSCANASMTGSGTDACTVSLNLAAPAGGLTVSLASSNSAVTVPAAITVPAGATSSTFSATVAAVSTLQTATITATANGASQTFALQLNASIPTLSISASSVAFGSISVGSSVSQVLTLSSTGNAAVTVSAASVTGSGFSFTGIAFPLTINPGQSSTMTVTFAPALSGSITGKLSLTSNSSSGSSSVVALSGSGLPVLSGLSCTSSSISGSGSDACTVTLNAAAPTGGTAVSLASNNTSVTVPTTVTVPAGSTSAGFTATISAVSTAQTATLTSTANSVSKSFAIQLNVGVSTLTVSSSSIAFGNVNVNSTATQSVILTSSGTAAVTISAISVSGTSFTFSSSALPITLNPGQTATLSVTFNPTAASAATGQVTITSTSSTSNPANVALSGTGVSVSHEVDLNWSAPTTSPDPVAGYFIYRATSGSSSYQQLNSSAVALTAYADTAVVSGQTYSYVVKSVDASGNLSTASNIATALIP